MFTCKIFSIRGDSIQIPSKLKTSDVIKHFSIIFTMLCSLLESVTLSVVLVMLKEPCVFFYKLSVFTFSVNLASFTTLFTSFAGTLQHILLCFYLKNKCSPDGWNLIHTAAFEKKHTHGHSHTNTHTSKKIPSSQITFDQWKKHVLSVYTAVTLYCLP